MKAILLSTTIVTLAATACCGQTGVLGIDSTGAGARFEDLKRDGGDFGPIIPKQPIARPELLSADERWDPGRKSEFAGTLAVKKPTAFKVGDWGCATCTFRVLDKVNEKECLVVPKFRNADAMLVRGFDLKNVSEGAEFVLRHPVVIQETSEITTAAGGKQAVLVLDGDRFDAFYAARQQDDQAKQAGAGSNAAVREWTDAEGRVLAPSAKFIEFKDNLVRLESAEDGKAVEFAMTDLSREDRQWIREELKRRRAKE
ncbi:MAG: SHD1 domain-containing protein [Planctomycetaceae bacterium]